MISKTLKTEILSLIKEIEIQVSNNKKDSALTKLQKLQKKITQAKDPIDQILHDMINREIRSNFIRILTPTSDSGWLPTGAHIETNVKYYARKNNIGREGYFLCKNDTLDKSKWSKKSSTHLYQKPWPIWHQQPTWKNNFRLPKDL